MSKPAANHPVRRARRLTELLVTLCLCAVLALFPFILTL